MRVRVRACAIGKGPWARFPATGPCAHATPGPFHNPLPQPPPHPRADGVVAVGQRQLLELEDLAGGYRRPSIVDIKVGHRTWYPEAGDEAYIARCK